MKRTIIDASQLELTEKVVSNPQRKRRCYEKTYHCKIR